MREMAVFLYSSSFKNCQVIKRFQKISHFLQDGKAQPKDNGRVLYQYGVQVELVR